ncbi:MAG: RNase A-like domain-containing protein [Allomuricauda sp.]
MNNKAFTEAVGKNPELLDSWTLLDNLGADEVLRKSKEALEYFTNGRTDKILLDVEELLGGHSKARHGSNLSMVEMEQRVLGTHPVMPQSRSALKFDSDAIHEDAVSKAFQNYKTTIKEHFKTSDDYLELDFEYGSKIGEGFTNKGTRSNPISMQVETSKVRITFKRDVNSPDGYILDSAHPLYE